jgi:hypothetical protein
MLSQLYSDTCYGQYFYLLLCSGATRLSRNFPSLQARNIIYVEKEIEVRGNLLLKNEFSAYIVLMLNKEH